MGGVTEVRDVRHPNWLSDRRRGNSRQRRGRGNRADPGSGGGGWSSGFSLGRLTFVVFEAYSQTVAIEFFTRQERRLKPELQPTTKGTNHGPSLRRILEIAVRIITTPRIAAPPGGRVRWGGLEPAGDGIRLGAG